MFSILVIVRFSVGVREAHFLGTLVIMCAHILDDRFSLLLFFFSIFLKTAKIVQEKT